MKAAGGDRRFWGLPLALSQARPSTCGLTVGVNCCFQSSEVFILYLIIQSEIKHWDLIADGYNLITWDPEASGIQVQGQPGLGSESLGQ